jgi:hypothetical protein
VDTERSYPPFFFTEPKENFLSECNRKALIPFFIRVIINQFLELDIRKSVLGSDIEKKRIVEGQLLASTEGGML